MIEEFRKEVFWKIGNRSKGQKEEKLETGQKGISGIWVKSGQKYGVPGQGLGHMEEKGHIWRYGDLVERGLF
jgi:hypothetical protein